MAATRSQRAIPAGPAVAATTAAQSGGKLLRNRSGGSIRSPRSTARCRAGCGTGQTSTPMTSTSWLATDCAWRRCWLRGVRAALRFRGRSGSALRRRRGPPRPCAGAWSCQQLPLLSGRLRPDSWSAWPLLVALVAALDVAHLHQAAAAGARSSSPRRARGRGRKSTPPPALTDTILGSIPCQVDSSCGAAATPGGCRG